MRPTLNNTHPVFYSFRRCPYAMRARMAIAASGLQVELREVVLRDKPQDMLNASAKGTVPVLVIDNSSVIDESLDVMIWALKQADPYAWLEPEIEDLPSIKNLISRCDGEFKHHLDRYKYATRYEGAVASEHREAAGEYLQALERRLELNVYLFGSRPSLADHAIMPFIRQFASTDKEWFKAAPYPKLQAWLDKLLISEIFSGVMSKYSQWHVGQTPVLFPA